jgi:hypothetical protein
MELARRNEALDDFEGEKAALSQEIKRLAARAAGMQGSRRR